MAAWMEADTTLTLEHAEAAISDIEQEAVQRDREAMLGAVARRLEAAIWSGRLMRLPGSGDGGFTAEARRLRVAELADDGQVRLGLEDTP